MSKYRVYDLAKEFNTDSKTVLNILRGNNITVKSHASTVGDDERRLVENKIAAVKQTVSVKQIAPVRTQQIKQYDDAAHKTTVAGDEKREKGSKPKAGLPNDSKTNSSTAATHKTQYHEKKQLHRGNDKIKTTAQHQTDTVKINRSGNQHQSGEKSRTVNNDRPNRTTEQRRPQQSAQQHRNPVKDRTAAGDSSMHRSHHNDNTGNSRPGNNIRTSSSTGNTGNRSAGNTGNTGNRSAGNTGNRNTGNTTTNRGNSSNRGNTNRPNQNRHNNQSGGQSFNSHRNNGRKNWRGNRNNRNHPIQQKQEIIRPKIIKVGESISVKELASKMTYTVTDVIKKLMTLGIMATINQEIDFDTAVLVAAEFNINVEELPPEVDLTEIPEIEDAARDLRPRPPVVTVMGHVDHGKTSLLDVIRKTSVTSNEAGGITQHIGAYQVMCKDKKIVFLDTPGHEAFTAMRARGAQVTDIAVLVVAADDGVMPQTLEAINHAKSAKVPIVVAINKIDKPGANPEHVKQQLAEHELIAEDWGGDTIMVPVSAKQKLGINDLLEMILLVAEMQELKANPNHDARGVIIEAQLDKGRGPVATVLVQNGTLHIGDSIIAGTAFGKVRAMINDRGEKIKKAGPSVPVEVLGLSDVPEAGDEMAALDEHLARTIAEKRVEKQRTELIKNKKVSLDDLFQQINEGNIKDLNILLKTDVQGSLEALKTSLLGLNKSDEVRVNIVHSGVGAVNESDVMLASASNALILAFNVRPDSNARKLADTEDIDIRTYRVIYEAINDIEAAMKGMLAPKFKETIQGKVEIRQVMKFSKALVAGSYVLEGKITNTSKIRIVRDNIVVHEGQLESLRRFKDDVKEVSAGYECGITIENYRDFKEGDIIEAYIMEEIAPQSL
ncbi:translation initiation factor IF-2 [Pectinatus frisingensis]|uniref:translation initiation factor IF-2 n=1 Tax=Pectinatus frisingensis TaxID=865 RepID=UPI0018C659D3|nr:translation initiation factor IF-2 [Pectinatus frisingensis]